MFDGLLKPKFSSKCKSYIKLTKMRLDPIRKKKSTVVKYLRSDIAHLLRNGLDFNAYGRADGLLAEQNMLSCYNFINNFCDIIMDNLSLMQKERECPKECREAIASLIYAAARFSDLPELCQLRSLFTERYGNSLESFTNKEFIDKFGLKHHTKKTMLQSMKEIAKEDSFEWSSKVLEQNLHTSPPPTKPDPISFGDPNNVRFDQIDSNFASDRSSEEDDTSTDQEELDNQKLFHHRFIPPPYLKPRSVRTRTLKPPPPQTIHPIDEEERLIDGLLLHYSRKESPPDGEDGVDESESETNKKAKGVGRPTRVASLPAEGRRRSESMKKSVRTNSLQPATQLHVHPNLPDCDELTARFAALKTRIKQ